MRLDNIKKELKSLQNTWVITGVAGFIGSNLLEELLKLNQVVVGLDNFSTGHRKNLDEVKSIVSADQWKNFKFHEGDITNLADCNMICSHADYVLHQAALGSVPRSIENPVATNASNISGFLNMLEAARSYYDMLKPSNKKTFRFIHISTDEVYGDLVNVEDYFTESSLYKPSSPYSASKASSDHLARAWNKTYQLPVIVTNCSNNYGPFQYPEKLIPLIIKNAINCQPLPIYGNGSQIRDWLYVDDHIKALLKVLSLGVPGETYCIGGSNEKTNIDVVKTICTIMNKLLPKENLKYEELITHVEDRPGHDVRYAIDATKIRQDLGWIPDNNFDSGIEKTVKWYLSNLDWYDDKNTSKRRGLI